MLGALTAVVPLMAAADQAAAPCRVPGMRHEVLCGAVMRPLDPGQPHGMTIAVHYVVAPAIARTKQADPVFFLAGGPGQGAIALAGRVMPLFARLNNRRDIVFIDQRGTGRSAPLNCPEPAHATAHVPDAAQEIARLQACRVALAALPHGDLRQYTTPIAMADADAVRAALGAERLNLVGGSYGTRAALDYLRQFPAHVRRVVIDGVAPPDMVLPQSFGVDAQAVLDDLFARCAADAGCASRHPDVAGRWQALLRSLPRATSLPDPANGRPVDGVLTRATVASAMRAPLYAPALAAALPYAVAEAADGRFGPLFGLASGMASGRRDEFAQGMHFSVICTEDFPRLPPGPLPGELGEALAAPYRAVCPQWPRGSLPADFDVIRPSAAPVLALSGGRDPVTPPRHAQRVVQALGPKARHVVVAEAGHGILSLGCARDVVERFIEPDDEATALAVDATCLAAVPAPPLFELPQAEAPVGAALP